MKIKRGGWSRGGGGGGAIPVMRSFGSVDNVALLVRLVVEEGSILANPA